MRRNVLTCDRCDEEIRNRAGSTRVEIGPDLYDVCVECRDAFGAFMENRAGEGSGVPKGFKRVQRPCPHHVPCAEPWGCSGDELVPI